MHVCLDSSVHHSTTDESGSAAWLACSCMRFEPHPCMLLLVLQIAAPKPIPAGFQVCVCVSVFGGASVALCLGAKTAELGAYTVHLCPRSAHAH
jgi:hypothetical protein